MNICCHCHGTLGLQACTYHINVILVQYKRMSQWHGLTGNESSREQMFLAANTVECESSRERKFSAISLQGAKIPGSELARVLLADSLLGANRGVA